MKNLSLKYLNKDRKVFFLVDSSTVFFYRHVKEKGNFNRGTILFIIWEKGWLRI